MTQIDRGQIISTPLITSYLIVDTGAMTPIGEGSRAVTTLYTQRAIKYYAYLHKQTSI